MPRLRCLQPCSASNGGTVAERRNRGTRLTRSCGSRLYLGSANLTGAGLGAKNARRRNFEMGLVSDDPALVDTVADLFEAVWSGAMCKKCDRQAFCPAPLESPWDAK